jgi:short-subunit dehydrogenase
MPCDLRDLGQVTELVSEVKRSFGEVDIMIAVASTIEVGPLEAMNAGDFEEAMCSIFDTALHPTLAVLPDMRARKKGSLVYIASIGGKIAVPHLAPYTSAKFAVVGLAESLRAELNEHGVGVLTVVPGLMRTGSYVHAHFKGAAEDEYAWFGATSTSPVTAMGAERAARRIVKSIERRDDELVLTATAKLATRAKGIVPSFVSFLVSIAARLLPKMPSDPFAKARLREGADIERTSTSTKVAAVRAQGLPLQLANHQT